MPRHYVCIMALCALACSSSSSSQPPAPPGTSSVSGTAGQQMVSLNDATGFVGSIMTNGGTGQETDVLLTTFVGACASFEENGNPASAGLLVLAVASASPVGPGMYSVTSTGATRVLYEAQDANCITQVQETADSGTITYDSVSGSMIVGSLDVTFPGGDHLFGSFSAPVCGSPESIVMMAGNAAPAACQHPG